MIWLSDNSALSALAEIGQLSLLPSLFGTVWISESVVTEGLHPRAPDKLKVFMTSRPEWLTIVPDPDIFLNEVGHLGKGEAAVITLAIRSRTPAAVILDDREARRTAVNLGLQITGVLGILEEAASRKLIDFEEILSRLLETGFRLHPALIMEVRFRLSTRE